MSDPARDRTWNLLLRRQAPCPLGHRTTLKEEIHHYKFTKLKACSIFYFFLGGGLEEFHNNTLLHPQSGQQSHGSLFHGKIATMPVNSQ